MNSRDRLKDYYNRLHKMEEELDRQRVQSACKIRFEKTKQELERSDALHREEEELNRLKESEIDDEFPPFEQTDEFVPAPQADCSLYDYETDLERQRMEFEEARLKILRDKVDRQIQENFRLKARLAYAYPRPVPPYFYDGAFPPAQTAADEDEQTEPLTEEIAVAEEELDDVPQGSVAFEGNSRLTFLEAYALLAPAQKHYCDGLIAYACKQSGEERRDSKYHVSVGCGFGQVIKVLIKNNIVNICARMEDNSLRDLRLSDTDTPIKTRETTVKVVDNGAYETAKRLVDLRIGQIAESIAEKKQLRKEKRREMKDGKK